MSETIIDERETLVQAAKRHGEPEWFSDNRLVAFDSLNKSSLPSIPRFSYNNWPLLSSPRFEARETELGLLPEGIVHQDCQFMQVGQTTIRCQLDETLTSQGVIVMDLFEAMIQYPDIVRQYLMTVAMRAGQNKLNNFHQAFLSNGCYIYIPKNVSVTEPLEIQFLQDASSAAPFVPHLLVVADQGSKVSIVHHVATVGEISSSANVGVEIIGQENSQIHYAAVDEMGVNTTAYIAREAHLASNARIDWSIGEMNLGDVIADCVSNLNGNGSQGNAKVVAITEGKQKTCLNTKVINRGQHSVGNILQRGVLLDESNLVFNGIGDIIHGASGAQADQENRILMMSDGAHGDANPILLIDENDVLAGHAASVGQVDETQMYYLMSRGIDQRTAKRLVIRGFLSAVLSAMPAHNVREHLKETIERKLEND